jgi:hypothetical protein
MTWRKLLAEKRVAREPANKQELDDLRAVVARSFSDAQALNLSPDGKFGFGYNAARTLSTIVVRASGYRVRSQGGGHYNTFLALEAADPVFARLAAYFDTCREKRNEFSYDEAGVVSATEADELEREALQFAKEVDAWLTRNHRGLV